MSLQPGARLGPYEILSDLGAGGMGEVYRARDRKLDRDVAIKVLPAALAGDAERINRFEQEAKATSALNHPNILTVYEIGEQDGSPFIVTELLEGDELRARLRDEPLPLRTAIDYARQIVSGLAAAHEKGVVHRDLKPENVFVTRDERVKILDFGLAKLVGPAGVGTTADGMTRRAMTEPGFVMGTIGYMSPEQARGQAADHRSDLFSFGAILYEMIGGQRAFGRDTTAETIAAILKEEPPDLDASHIQVPPALERIVRRCLEKRPDRRFQSTADLAFAIDALSAPSGFLRPGSGPTPAVSSAPAPARARLPWMIGGVIALVTVGALGLMYANRRAPSTPAVGDGAIKLAFAPPADLGFNDTKRDDAVVSPDGRMIAFTANAGNGDNLIYVQTLASGETRTLPDTVEALEPFWSPDSRSIAFGSRGKLKRVDLSGGTPQVLCDAARLTGGTWNRENVIVFGSDYGSALFQVPAAGGEPRPVTSLDAARGGHSHPSFLPDGRHFVFSRGPAEPENGAPSVAMGSLDSPALTRVLAGDTNAVYAPPGWLVFFRNQVLLAQAFDAERLQVTGDAVPIVAGAATESGFRAFSVSDNGVLVSHGPWQRQYQLVWLDRAGRPIGALGEAAPVTTGLEPTISPDGAHVVFKRDGHIWASAPDGSAAIRLGPGQLPAWSPDSRRVVFASGFAGLRGIVQRSANGIGDPELLLGGTALFPKAFSPDGRFLLYMHRGEKTRADIWSLPRDGSGTPRPLLQSAADEHLPAFSPDGRWLAFVSDESGSYEIYLQSFMPDGTLGNDRRRLSSNGGVIPTWRRDGQELFYIDRDGQMMSTAIRKKGSVLESDPPRALFKTRTLNLRYSAVFREFDVTPDGQRFLVGTLIGDAKSPLPTVVVNWTALTRR